LDVQKRLKGLFEAYYEGLGKVVIKGRVVSASLRLVCGKEGS
jgi:hypothetical protein